MVTTEGRAMERKAAEAIRDGYWPTDYSLGAAQQN
jgi:hypothetical protein